MSTQIEEFLKSLVVKGRIPPPRSILLWPPDVFALAGSLLQSSGAYCSSVCEWKRDGVHDPRDVVDLGRRWKDGLSRRRVPAGIRRAWDRVLSNRRTRVNEIGKDELLVGALLDLVGAADEACQHLRSVFGWATDLDEFMVTMTEKKSGTLCRCIDSDMARVLPKGHTPQTGMTFRSLTHYLSLCPGGEVGCEWVNLPTKLSSGSDPIVNLLAIPYPYELKPGAFSRVDLNRCGRAPLHPEFGFYHYCPPDPNQWVKDDLPKLLAKVKSRGVALHGVVLPEAALPEEAFGKVTEVVHREFPDAFVLSGVVAAPGNGSKIEGNHLKYAVPLLLKDTRDNERLVARFEQAKHHRWKLDDFQLDDYGLVHLERGRQWWEYVDISKRKVHFFAATSALTFCFLICEDLARQEPVAPLVRAVGPHLVIALLQDGPQRQERWPGRYAGVLAEDPGCSVLTLSSAGMVRMSKRASGRGKISVGLWRDPKSPPKQIEMPASARAVILSLRSQRETEYSADGRRNANAVCLALHDCTPI